MPTETTTTPAPARTEVPPTRHVPTLAEDARAGLLAPPRSLPPKYFYDDRGSRLFERLCATPEYYPSRTEAALLAEHADAIMATAAPDHFLELGSGSSRKTRYLLDAWPDNGTAPVYWPFDVAERFLLESGAEVGADYPWLTVHALIGDYHGGLAGVPLPAEGRRLSAFLGGTIGNFEPAEAEAILGEIAGLLRPGDHLLLGADRVKDPAVLEAAYDDAAGETAAFNHNLLHVLNRELDADFPPDAYRHRAVFEPQTSRVEMRLVAERAHMVCLQALNREIGIAAGEEIRTEISRKFTRASLGALLSAAGLREAAHFEADDGWYSLVLATR